MLGGTADSLQGEAALEALDFYVHVDMFANPSASLAHLRLPASTCWGYEAVRPCFTTSEDTTWAQLRGTMVQPQHQSRPDLEITFDLAKRLGWGEHFFDGDIEAAFNSQLAPAGLIVQQLRAPPVGMRVEDQRRYEKYAGINPQTGQPRGFRTPSRIS